ncbi:hypothetical protein AB0J86_27180 [Micromonospora sp. NPDC049559]|uniref:hypothetical protein n=1 Tax=Micromonospora sp. NPDC049559 TaxID=3155923 RepID=UPI003433F032
MRRWGVLTATGLVAGAGLLGLTGCGAAGPVAAPGPVRDGAVEVASVLGTEGQALAALGFDTADVDTADVATADVDAPGPSASPGAGTKADRPGHPRSRARVLLRRGTLHGEAVVRTADGTRTIAVQRGTVTAVDDASMTVRSTDGFQLTWKFDQKLRVVERRTTVQPSAVKVGTELGVAGSKDGDRGVARLIVIPVKK